MKHVIVVDANHVGQDFCSPGVLAVIHRFPGGLDHGGAPAHRVLGTCRAVAVNVVVDAAP